MIIYLNHHCSCLDTPLLNKPHDLTYHIIYIGPNTPKLLGL